MTGMGSTKGSILVASRESTMYTTSRDAELNRSEILLDHKSRGGK